MASYGFPGGILRRSRQAFNAAAYTCEARHTLDPVFQQEWNDEQQLGLIFDYWAQYFLPCMDAQGYLIPTGNNAHQRTLRGGLPHAEPPRLVAPATTFLNSSAPPSETAC